MTKRFIESGDHALFWAVHGIESPFYRQCRDEALARISRTVSIAAISDRGQLQGMGEKCPHCQASNVDSP